MKAVLLAAAAAALAVPAAHAQTILPRVFVQNGVKAKIAALVPEARAKGSSGATLADYGSYKIELSVRTSSGGAEVHAHWDDVILVEQGRATLVTGGTVMNGKTSAGGETHGSGIAHGHSQTIAAGTVYTIRAGTPHQLLLPPHTLFSAVVIKVHEP